MRKLFSKIHLWLSLPIGIIIAIICISGSILVFEREILEACYPSRYFVKEAQAEAMPVGRVLKMVRQQLPEDVDIKSVQISSDPSRAWILNTEARFVCYYVNPYTAEITYHQQGRNPFFMTTMRLHRWLLGEYKRDGSFSLGKTVVGVSTIIMVIILISGIVIWVPRSKKALKNRLTINCKKGWLRFFYDLHVAGGIYTVIILLVLALTGLTWSFGWYRNAFYAVFGVEMTAQAAPHGAPASAAVQKPQGEARTEHSERGEGQERGARPENAGERSERRGENTERTGGRPSGEGQSENRGGGRPANAIEWNKALASIEAQFPNYRTITIQPGSASVSTTKYGNTRASDRVTFDNQTGDISDIQYYKDQPKSSKIRGWIYAVHVGAWGGTFTKIITCIVSLLGGVFALSGYYFWWRKRSVKRNRLSKKV